LLKLAQEKPALIDIELETLKINDDLADSLEGSTTRILVSWHNFDTTPPSEDLVKVINEMRVFSNYIKIVTMARNIGDSFRLLDLYDASIGLYAIIFAMGEPGIITRILCTLSGSAPFTYASLEKPTAPGQIPLSEMKRLYSRIFKDRKI
jgi:3-dehydroquinate dehydratase type I